MMEVAVTAGAVRLANHHHATISFYRPDALPVAQPTVAQH